MGKMLTLMETIISRFYPFLSFLKVNGSCTTLSLADLDLSHIGGFPRI